MNGLATEQEFRIERIPFEMPSPWTFSIPSIAEFVKQEMTPGVWVDPYAGQNSPAEITNDINPANPAKFHMDALEFLKIQADASAEGVIYDPPYSPRQVKECYTAIGIKPDFDMFNAGYNSEVKKQISRIVKPGGKVLCFGWNSSGIGKGLGFQLYRVRLVAHGSSHNDTICTAERRLNGTLF